MNGVCVCVERAVDARVVRSTLTSLMSALVLRVVAAFSNSGSRFLQWPHHLESGRHESGTRHREEDRAKDQTVLSTSQQERWQAPCRVGSPTKALTDDYPGAEPQPSSRESTRGV